MHLSSRHNLLCFIPLNGRSWLHHLHEAVVADFNIWRIILICGTCLPLFPLFSPSVRLTGWIWDWQWRFGTKAWSGTPWWAPCGSLCAAYASPMRYSADGLLAPNSLQHCLPSIGIYIQNLASWHSILILNLKFLIDIFADQKGLFGFRSVASNYDPMVLYTF